MARQDEEAREALVGQSICATSRQQLRVRFPKALLGILRLLTFRRWMSTFNIITSAIAVLHRAEALASSDACSCGQAIQTLLIEVRLTESCCLNVGTKICPLGASRKHHGGSGELC